MIDPELAAQRGERVPAAGLDREVRLEGSAQRETARDELRREGSRPAMIPLQLADRDDERVIRRMVVVDLGQAKRRLFFLGSWL
jgi:hypothetical protein